MLGQPASLNDCIDKWECKDANKAKAYEYLCGLDLFGSVDEDGLRLRNLNSIEARFRGHAYLALTSYDPLLASPLKARLKELGYNISVEIAQQTNFS